VVPTYNNETILAVPQVDGDDKAVMQNFGHKVCEAALASAHLPVGERQAHVERAVRQMQKDGAFQVTSKDKEDMNA
jgi:hypothetical protein